MVSHTTPARADEADGLLFDSWFDPIEDGLRAKVRGFIEAMIEEELTTALARPRYGRRRNDEELEAGVVGHRHGRRTRRLTGTFGSTGGGRGGPKYDCEEPRATLDALQEQRHRQDSSEEEAEPGQRGDGGRHDGEHDYNAPRRSAGRKEGRIGRNPVPTQE